MILFKRGLLYVCFVTVFVCLPSSESSGRSPWFGGPAYKAEVENVPLPTTIKVALLHSRQAVRIGCTGSYTYVDLKKGKPVSVSRKSVLKIKKGKGGVAIGTKIYSTVLISPTQPDEHLTLNGRPYRGSFFLRARGGAVDVIEQIGLEDYLNGVLPREVGVDWPVESLKAQAVISRTYVVANLGKSKDKGYDVTNNVYSQVYGGLQDENPATNQAVVDTRSEILLDDHNQPVQTFFHSSCGGRTESPQYVWQEMQDPPNYLDSVKDEFCRDDPFYTWEFTISADSLQRRLRRAGYSVGTVTKIKTAKTSPSGRAWVIAVDSSRGRTKIPGNSFRLALGPDALRSTLLTSIEKDGKKFHFEGHGWGHGVGLCQWGARGRALAGQPYTEILDAYYPKVRLVKGLTPGETAGEVNHAAH